MYDFYYNTIKEKYEEKFKFYMDTDSLFMEIKTEDFYADMKSMINEFDTSDYPKNNPYNIPLINKKVLGKFKDELGSKIMEEFIGLRSKLYAYKVFETEKETKKYITSSVYDCTVEDVEYTSYLVVVITLPW